MRTNSIILDRLDAALKKQGVTLKRGQLLEAAATAFGYHNSHEYTASAKKGELDAPRPEYIGIVAVGDEELAILRCPSGAPYGIDASFLDQVVGEERREAFGPSPYGGLLDLRQVAEEAESEHLDGGAFFARGDRRISLRYAAYDNEMSLLGETNDLEEAKALCWSHEEDEGNRHITAVVDRQDWMLLRGSYFWRPHEMPKAGVTTEDQARTAALLLLSQDQNEDLAREINNMKVTCMPDWRSWEKDLKKAARRGQEPINDEMLHRFRHAVADNHSKSSAGERSQSRYRVQIMIERHLGGLLHRLDRAEEALRSAGIAPAEIERKGKDEAEEILAAIAGVETRKESNPFNLHRIKAMRDGDVCEEIFRVKDGQDSEERGREIAAHQFRLRMEDFRDEDGTHSAIDSECDYFSVEKLTVPKEVGILEDALSEIIDLGISHPARLKILAVLQKIRPKETA